MKRKLYLFLADNIAPIFLRVIFKTLKIKILRKEIFDEFIKEKKNFILVFWHGKMLLPVLLHQNLNITALVSKHGDGEIIARILTKLGYNLIRGSSARGGKKAFEEMVELLGNKGRVVITPDGPNGPPGKVKIGTIRLAKLTQAPIIPVSFSCNKKK